MTRMRALGRASAQLADQFAALVRVAIERDEADVGLRLGYHVGEELVARALGLEPDGLHAQQRRLERIAGRVFRIDNGNTKDVAHGCCQRCES